jgi:hypothetical protein
MILRSSLQACDRPVVVASHMRSGTHLMIDLLRRQFDACRSWKWPGERNDMLYLPLDVLTQPTAGWSEERALKVLHRAKRPILKTHWTLPDLGNLRDSQPDFADWINANAVFLHVVRNPFHVLASQWAWDCSLSPVPPLPSLPDADWISSAISGWNHHYGIWAKREKVHLFRYEEIMADPQKTIDRLTALLDEAPLMLHPLLPDKLRSGWQSRWNRIAGIRPASTEIITAGGPPDPADVFNDESIDLIHRIAGEALEALGYGFPGGVSC